jgi:cytochrome c-type protein NapC
LKSIGMALAAVMICAAAPAGAVDWSRIGGTEMVLFHPGQVSYEWSLAADHAGAGKVREGKTCRACHLDEERSLGAALASGGPHEPQPIAGKPGAIAATVKAARDERSLHVRLEFAEGVQPNAGMDPEAATKVTMILTGDGAAEGQRHGCWALCHDDATSMPAANGAERRMYLGGTRVRVGRRGGGDDLKPAAHLDGLRAAGYAMELWQARLNPGGMAAAGSGIVFTRREAADTGPVTAAATFADGVWSVTLSRPLKAGAPWRDLVADRTYTIGFAIHAGHTAKRFHYVSLERMLTLSDRSVELR